MKACTRKPRVLILYDYFYPGYKAGGPIQSLVNLAVTLQQQYSISVITSAFDLRCGTSHHNMKINAWNAVDLPGAAAPVNIWYAVKKDLGLKKLKEIIQEVRPGVIYLNGIFSYSFFLLPLVAIRKLSYQPRVVICPRGMLQPGALSGKWFKKKLYIAALRISGLLRKKVWHATSTDEKQDIRKVFRQAPRITIASNIPGKPAAAIQFTHKRRHQLRLIYLSLIAEKKNLAFTLELINQCNAITLDIYGPIKDVGYWSECKKLMMKEPGKISYKGEVMPAHVQETFKQYDASILLTKGENFGHALYESLGAGRPIITSNFTPWINLEQQKAGWNMDINSTDRSLSLLRSISDIPADEFNVYCAGAHLAATNYYNRLKSVCDYEKLFS